MIYQAALRNEMQQRLGVAFAEGNEHGQAEILGVPQVLLFLWSKRTTQIDGAAAPKIAEYEKLLGRTLTPSERVNVVKTAVLKTRPGKEHPELSALHGHWTAEAEQSGFTSEQLLTSVRAAAASVGVQPPSPEGAVTDQTLAQTLAQSLPETLAQTLARPAWRDQRAPSGTDGVLPRSCPRPPWMKRWRSQLCGRRGSGGRCSPVLMSRGRSPRTSPPAACPLRRS